VAQPSGFRAAVHIVGLLLHHLRPEPFDRCSSTVGLLAAVSDMVGPRLSIHRPRFLIDVVQSLNFLWPSTSPQSQPSILRPGPLVDFDPIAELV
jgi:hypothetical protein